MILTEFIKEPYVYKNLFYEYRWQNYQKSVNIMYVDSLISKNECNSFVYKT